MCAVPFCVKPGNGAVVLVLGVVAWCGPHFIAGIPAWIIGNQSLKEMDMGLMDPKDRSMVQAGRLLGMISTILSLVAICLFGAIFALVAIESPLMVGRGLLR
jgi:hypothetical protein